MDKDIKETIKEIPEVPEPTKDVTSKHYCSKCDRMYRSPKSLVEACEHNYLKQHDR